MFFLVGVLAGGCRSEPVAGGPVVPRAPAIQVIAGPEVVGEVQARPSVEQFNTQLAGLPVVCRRTRAEIGDAWRCDVTAPELLELSPELDPRLADASRRRPRRAELASAAPAARKKERRRRSRPQAVAAAPEPTKEPIVDTVLRRKLVVAPEPTAQQKMLGGYADRLDGLRRGLRTSPMADETIRQMEDAEAALTPEIRDLALREKPGRILMNGDPMRRREVIHSPRTSCLKALNDGLASKRPASLGCVRSVVRYQHASQDDTMLAMDILTILTGFPLWANIKELRTRVHKNEAISRTLWTLDWLRWVEHQGGRLPKALAALAPGEKRALRRMLPRWWQKTAYDSHRPLISKILEKHFLAIAPGCRANDGTPERTCFKSPWLWASNWYAAVPKSRVKLAMASLPKAQQAELLAYRGLPAGLERGEETPGQDAPVSHEQVPADGEPLPNRGA